MTSGDWWSPQAEELRYALAEADAQTPSAALRERTVTTALAQRPPGRPLDLESLSPYDAFRRTVASFDEVLGDLDGVEWSSPTIRDLTVQGLVGHLIGVEHDFHVALGLVDADPIDADATDTDHIDATRPFAMAQTDRRPVDTHHDWTLAVARTLDHLGHLAGADLAETVVMHGISLPLPSMLVVRLFEMWTHEEDIRRATGRPLVTPEAGRLRLMADLAVPMLPLGMELAGRSRPYQSARLVLLGPGGGTWESPPGQGASRPTDVRIVVDEVAFCRLVANRIAPDETGALLSGDEELGADVLVGAAALALD